MQRDGVFRIYYGDGVVYEGGIDDLPAENSDNAQAFAWNDPENGYSDLGRVVIKEWDIYIYSDKIGWHGTNKYADLMMHLRKGIGPGGVRAVMTGCWIPKADYIALVKRAETDPGLALKSASDAIRENGAE